jgi:hypothetical protein
MTPTKWLVISDWKKVGHEENFRTPAEQNTNAKRHFLVVWIRSNDEAR